MTRRAAEEAPTRPSRRYIHATAHSAAMKIATAATAAQPFGAAELGDKADFVTSGRSEELSHSGNHCSLRLTSMHWPRCERHDVRSLLVAANGGGHCITSSVVAPRQTPTLVHSSRKSAQQPHRGSRLPCEPRQRRRRGRPIRRSIRRASHRGIAGVRPRRPARSLSAGSIFTSTSRICSRPSRSLNTN